MTKPGAAVLFLFISASSLYAQNPVQPIFTICPTSTRALSARQVQSTAKPLEGSLGAIRLTVAATDRAADFTIVVDTLGKPESGSLTWLRPVDSTLRLSIVSSYLSWRFQPAKASGCKVRQRLTATASAKRAES